jgi:hypothetical protein
MRDHRFTPEDFRKLRNLGGIHLPIRTRRLLQGICSSYTETWGHADQPSYSGVCTELCRISEAARALRLALDKPGQEARAAWRELYAAHASPHGHIARPDIIDLMQHIEEAAVTAQSALRTQFGAGGQPKRAPQLIDQLAAFYRQAGGQVATAERSKFYKFVEAVLEFLDLPTTGLRDRLRALIGGRISRKKPKVSPSLKGSELRQSSANRKDGGRNA